MADNADHNALYDFIIAHFRTNEDLKELCFRLDVNYDDLPGEGRKGKVRELVLSLRHSGRLEELRGLLAVGRPEAWAAQFGPAEAQKPGFSAETRFLRERNPRQVFISHAQADRVFAQRLAADLRADGRAVWIAPDSIRPGERWVEAIDRGLESSGVFLLVLSPAGVASRWVRKETNIAVEMEVEGLLSLVPVRVAECNVPSVWRDYQYVSFEGDYAAALKALRRRLVSGTEEPEQPEPEPPKKIEPEPQQATKPPAKQTQTAATEPPPLPVIDTATHPQPWPDRFIHQKTGIEFMRIPAGKFLYGDDKKELTLPDYWMARAPVTNAQYKLFVDVADHRAPSHWQGSSPPPGKLDHPVVNVTWDDAQAFADWAGLRLPTEQEWEKAARGTDGRIYPWGDEPPTPERCNFGRNVGDTTPVGRYSPEGDSPYGLVDAAGNVWEWTGPWFDTSQRGRVLRGGSWSIIQRFARVAVRFDNWPVDADSFVGFRVVAPVGSGS